MQRPVQVTGVPAHQVVERKTEEERATEKVTTYIAPPQYGKIGELRQQHRKKSGQGAEDRAVSGRHATGWQSWHVL